MEKSYTTIFKTSYEFFFTRCNAATAFRQNVAVP